MKIRQGKNSDFTQIKKLISLYPKKLMQTHLPKASEFFVALEDEKIIGCCALQVYSKRLAEVRSLVVADTHRSRGIAQKLIDHCLKKAKRLKIKEVLTITGAINLFSKFGFSSFNQEKFALFKILS